MKPLLTIDSERQNDGRDLTLFRRDDDWYIHIGTEMLMSSRLHGSEEEMARLATEWHDAAPKSFLVGGLGLGFTARAALDLAPRDGSVVVAEISAAVIRWNRELLGHLAGHPVDDPRLSIHHGDVAAFIADSPGRFDVILLDVDNGPAAMTTPENERLYDREGVSAIRRSLRPGGVVAFWSADTSPDKRFDRILGKSGFESKARRVAARGGAKRGGTHVIYLAKRIDAALKAPPIRRRPRQTRGAGRAKDSGER